MTMAMGLPSKEGGTLVRGRLMSCQKGPLSVKGRFSLAMKVG